MLEQRKGHPPRLPGWDYSRPGAYFVKQCWLDLPPIFPHIRLDSMIIMPDHVHAVVILPGRAMMNHGPTQSSVTDGGATQASPGCGAMIHHGPGMAGHDSPGSFQPLMNRPDMLLGKVIRAWKGSATRRIRQRGFRSFAWQSRYYEHIVRTHRN